MIWEIENSYANKLRSKKKLLDIIIMEKRGKLMLFMEIPHQSSNNLLKPDNDFPNIVCQT